MKSLAIEQAAAAPHKMPILRITITTTMTKNKVLLLLFLAIMAISSKGENYPYRSDCLWVTVPDHADWLYKTGEEAKVEIQFYKYGIPRDAEVEYSIGTDLL